MKVNKNKKWSGTLRSHKRRLKGATFEVYCMDYLHKRYKNLTQYDAVSVLGRDKRWIKNPDESKHFISSLPRLFLVPDDNGKYLKAKKRANLFIDYFRLIGDAIIALPNEIHIYEFKEGKRPRWSQGQKERLLEASNFSEIQTYVITGKVTIQFSDRNIEKIKGSTVRKPFSELKQLIQKRQKSKNKLSLEDFF